MISFTGPLQMWIGADGTSHYMRVPEDYAGEIRAHAMMVRRGFGSVRVEATVQDYTWLTSVFPVKSGGGYFLPVKIEVLRHTGIAAGDDVTIELELL